MKVRALRTKNQIRRDNNPNRHNCYARCGNQIPKNKTIYRGEKGIKKLRSKIYKFDLIK